MKRSGSTVQYQIASRLAADEWGARRIEWRPESEIRWEEEEARGDGPLVYKCHRCIPEIRTRLSAPGNLGVYTYRDIREVCASWVRKHNSTFSCMIAANFIEECIDNFRHFTAFPNVLVTRYEDLVLNLESEVERIARHLGISLCAARVMEIATDYSIDRQYERMQRVSNGKANSFWYGDQHIDRQELLHTNHITDGRTDAWTELFSKIEVAIIEEKAHRWMEENGYDLSNSQLGIIDRLRLARLRDRLGLAS
jgi:Sulfotransferase domain